MIKFSKYIREAYHDSIKGEGNKVVEIFKNPDRKEIKDSTSRFNDTRGIILGDKLHTWNADEALHHHVRSQLGIEGGVDVLIDHGKKEMQLWGDPEETRKASSGYTSSPHFQRHFKDYNIVT